jgi:transposase
LSLHRVRQGFVKTRKAQANQIRGLLSEFGLVIPQGITHIARRVPELIEDAANDLTGSFRLLIERLMEHLNELDRQVRDLEARSAIPKASPADASSPHGSAWYPNRTQAAERISCSASAKGETLIYELC